MFSCLWSKQLMNRSLTRHACYSFNIKKSDIVYKIKINFVGKYFYFKYNINFVFQIMHNSEEFENFALIFANFFCCEQSKFNSLFFLWRGLVEIV